MDFASLFSSTASMLTKVPDLSQMVDAMPNYWFEKRQETRTAFEVLSSESTLGYAKSLGSVGTGSVETAIKLTKALIDALIIIQNTKDVKDEQNMQLILGCIDCDREYVLVLKKWFAEASAAKEKNDGASMKIFCITAQAHDRLTDTMSRITNQWSAKIGGYTAGNNHIL